MTSTIDRPGVTTAPPLLLPLDPRRFGPISRKLLGRLAAGIAAVQIVGALMIFATDSDAMHAAGTSLVFPGAGFLYVASPLLFVVTAGLLVVALVLWWGASAHLAIPLVWGLSALGAAALANGPRLFVREQTMWTWSVPLAYFAAALSVAVAAYRVERSFRAKRALVPELNAYLASAPAAPDRREARPPDSMDAELLRWCLDVANQPNDGLDGLDWGDQFHSGTQLRYQLNALSWAMSLYAANFVPNAQGQIEPALARLIAKHTDLRVWSYWRTLNVLGNFDADPDPIRRDNIMFSAFLGDVLNIYEAATGSTRFDQPGSLTFVWKDGRTFAYDHHTIAAAVEENYTNSTLGFYACEPGWSFTVCNVMGAQSLYGHDRLHGTSAWERVRPNWLRALDEEYLTPDGSYAHIKSDIVGLAWDTGEVPGGHYLAAGSNRFADVAPEHARRASALERRRAAAKMKALAAKVTSGRLELELPVTLERNRARRSALGAWNQVIGGARLVGEHGLGDAALDAAARQCGTGERWPSRPLDSGVPGLGGHMIVRWSTPMSTADLNVRGYESPIGPIVTNGPWDQVLLTEARSADGVGLDISVEPMGAPVTARFDLERLQPNTAYETVGPSGYIGSVTSDKRGCAVLRVDLDRPVRFTLRVAR